MEDSGEKAFPLTHRWRLAGRTIFCAFLKEQDPKAEPPIVSLMEHVVRMLKGVMVIEAQVIVSSGPQASGGRSRSYSVGGMDDVQSLHPYPEDMYDAILSVLEKKAGKTAATEILFSLVLRLVVGSKSWSNGVFPRLPQKVKKHMASLILKHSVDDDVGNPAEVFFSLPLGALDIKELLAEKAGVSSDIAELASIATMMDFIQANAARLKSSTTALDLVGALFDLLSQLASASTPETEGLEFTCQAVVLSLCEVTVECDIPFDQDNQALDGWVTTLLALQGIQSEKDVTGPIKPFATARAKSAALSVLTNLGSRFPKKLTDALLKTAVSSVALRASNLGTVFSSVLSVFRGDLSKLLGDIIGTVLADDTFSSTERSDVWRQLAKALVTRFSDGDEESDAAVGGFAALLIAANRNSDVFADWSREALQIVEAAPAYSQISAAHLLLRYVKELSSELGAHGSLTSDATPLKWLPSHKRLAHIALNGKPPISLDIKEDIKFDSPGRRKVIVGLARDLIHGFSDSLLFEGVHKVIRKGRGRSTTLGLQMWQDLLVIRSFAQGFSTDVNNNETESWNDIALVAEECREHLQSILPADIFLASVTSLIKEDGANELRSKALRLVADRVLEVDSSGSEAILYVDLVPTILSLLEDNGLENKAKRVSLLQQSALVAIEHIARAVFRGSRSSQVDRDHFIAALARASSLISVTMDAASRDSLDTQLVSSVALSAATLVRVTGARSLPVLPKLIRTLVDVLALANTSTATLTDEELSLPLLQLSILRFLTAVTETVPQFLVSHINKLLNGQVLLSGSLRSTSDRGLQEAIKHLDKILPERVAARLFIPILAKAVSGCEAGSECHVLLSMLKLSIATLSSSEAAAHRTVILSIVTEAYENQDSAPNKMPLVYAANDALLQLILKLSEAQLRRIFASLRDWRGELDKSDPSKNAHQRLAFWMMCVALAKELRSIFIPCLDMVIEDLIAELELAASNLVPCRSAEKASGGRKKRKLVEHDIAAVDSYNEDCMRSLQPILHCLELTLRADAFEGGKWTRSDGASKYNAILEPLGKLLQCRIGKEFPLPSQQQDLDGFRYIVHGSDSDSLGSVVGCMTALGMAVGDEQLWKPLNHIVLEACSGGDSGRDEVKTGGLECLHSLMNSLGEEYMVLLPECLPVLSELLEDSNEEIAGLARDAVTLAEELIGESLEDSLR